jgi:ABC-type branched-subunit amino acid transport system substrate-binding protein
MVVHTRRGRALRLVTIVAVAGLLAAACGSDVKDDEATQTTADNQSEFVEITGVPGVTDDEIQYSALGTVTNNSLGTCVLKCYLDGINAYFDYRNSEGGIYGRKLVVTKEVDDEFGKNQQKALEIISANDTFGVFASSIIPNGWGEFAKVGWPVYGHFTDPGQAAHDNIFGSFNVDCVTCTRVDTAHLARAIGAKKIASLALGVSESSKKCGQSIVDSVALYSDEMDGAKVAYQNANIAYGLPNGAGPEVTEMKNAGVDMVFGCFDLNTTKTFAQEMQRQGIGDVPIVHRGSYDAKFVAENAQIFEGDIVLATVRPLEAEVNDSDLGLYKKWMDKRGAELSEESLHGWAVADEAFQGLKKVGGPFDRQKVIDATNTIEGFTAGGIVPPIDFGRQHEAPTQDDVATHGSKPYCRVLLQVKAGKFAFLKPSTKEKPFTCWPGTSRAWSEPEAMDFT